MGSYYAECAREEMIETWYRYKTADGNAHVFVGHGVDAASNLWVGFGCTWGEARENASLTHFQAAGVSRQHAHGEAIMRMAESWEELGSAYDSGEDLWDACEPYEVNTRSTSKKKR